MLRKIILFSLNILLSQSLTAQNLIDDFFYLEKKPKEIPIRIRGNLTNKIILVYVQGGPGENALDFARIDYPGWTNTLEKKVAIAYYDQRGLNQKVRKIDSSKINLNQYSQDLLNISEALSKKYTADIYLMGHSYGGHYVYHCLSSHPDIKTIHGGIILNTPITTEFSGERYTHYRPLYLKNLASEFIENDIEKEKWQKALDWIIEVDSINTPETGRIWNRYVESAFEPKDRKISFGDGLKVLFGRPYNPIKYLNQKDNEFVSNAIWNDERSYSFIENISKIQVPLLIMTGRYDDIAPPEEIHAAGNLIKGSSTFVIANSGHESFIDQPEIFSSEILKFLRLSY